MKNAFTRQTGFMTAAALCALMIASPVFAADDDQAAPDQAMTGPAAPAASSQPMQPAVAAKKSTDKGVEAHIKALHDQLKITSDEEEMWGKVANVMRTNIADMQAAMKDRMDKAGTLNAVDDIRSSQAMAAAHADGLTKLADAFATLYAAMPEAQQKLADKVFANKTEKHMKAATPHSEQ